MTARIKAYFVIASVEPDEETSGFYVKVLIKWEGKTGRPHRWGYFTNDGDALQAYKEALEWMQGKRKRVGGTLDGFGWNQDKYELVQHDWRKPKP